MHSITTIMERRRSKGRDGIETDTTREIVAKEKIKGSGRERDRYNKRDSSRD